ncbi:class I SAM-dependent methyltransferase [Catenulispora subtropica]|uniref:Methyltransferase type 11 domain-containing protein n=1 Tax=Catenulispora subtropica TaxID=450798 RepID=A0ABP5ENF9_9ACTN
MTAIEERIPHYDGLADWYDQHNAATAHADRDPLLELLGPGDGLCLDLGCGTGQHLGTLRASGRSVVGLDFSADQLRLARRRVVGGEALVRSDAAALPFRDGVFDAVATLWLSSDVDEFAGVVREAARVLRPGGVLVYYGVHPCFNGPHTEMRDDGARVVHPSYRAAGWSRPESQWREGGVRQRLGGRHVPLADLLNAFADAGLRITRVSEARNEPVPRALGLRGEKL